MEWAHRLVTKIQKIAAGRTNRAIGTLVEAGTAATAQDGILRAFG